MDRVRVGGGGVHGDPAVRRLKNGKAERVSTLPPQIRHCRKDLRSKKVLSLQ